MAKRFQRMRKWADRWMPAIIAAGCVVLAVVASPDVLAAARNEGRPGTFTSVAEDCSGRGGCSWRGSFLSDDGSVRADEVSYDGPGVEKAGDETAAQATRDEPGEVYPLNDRTWVLMLVLGAGGVAYLVWWVLRRGWRRR